MSLSRSDERLLRRVLDGEAGEAELEALRPRMREEPELRLALEQSLSIEEYAGSLPLHEPSRDLVAGAEQRLVAEAALEPAPRRWRRLLVWGTALTTAAAVMTLLFLPPRRTEVPPEPAAPERWVVTLLSGPTWVRQEGARRQAAVGDLLADGDRLETGPGATVTLTIAAGSVNVVLDETSHLGVVNAAARPAALMLDRGALRAAVQTGDGQSLSVHLRGSLHRVEIGYGRVGLLSDGEGSAVVACESGRALVHADDRDVIVGAGFEVESRAAAWGEPRRIALDLHLEVTSRVSGEIVTLHGRTNPGASVVVGGEPVQVNPDGTFSYRVELQETPPLLVSARDALLRKNEVELALERPAPRSPPARPAEPPPARDSEWDWGWEGERESPG